MNIEGSPSHIFRISICGIAVLSSLMQSMAEGSALPGGLTIPLAVIAMFFTDSWKRFELSLLWTNVLGILAFIAAGVEFSSDRIEARLLAGAHLLSYLLWIVLFMPKEDRQHWWILVLGVLQVAVGSVLTSQSWYGALLLGYLVLTFWTLAVFLMNQSYEKQLELALASFHDTPQVAFENTSGSSAVTAAAVTAAGVSAAGVSAASLSHRFRQAGHVRDSVQIDPGEPWVTWRFGVTLLQTVVASMVLGMVVFALIPRIWIGRSPFHDDPIEATRAVSGFTDVVRLGDFGTILESNDRVLEVRLFDNKTNEQIDVADFAMRNGLDEPLFRGAIMWRYHRGQWNSRGPLGGYIEFPHRRIPQGAVRQEYRLHQTGTPYIFAMHPLYACRIPQRGNWPAIHVVTGAVFHRSDENQKESFEYQIYSPGVNSTVPPFSPFELMPLAARRSVAVRYLWLPDQGLDRLHQLARDVALKSAPESESDDALRAERLLAFLRDEGTFSYSLDTSILDPSIDPVEDFLFNRRYGHCEYFASALTLMLRAVDVPARLINGYKGGHRNSLTGTFEVQQRHAHSWVEAFVNDQWIVLDPTPAIARTEVVASAAPRFTSLWDVRMTFDEIWTRMVVHTTLSQQRQNIYGPLADAFNRWWNDSTSESADAGWGAKIRAFISSRERWFSWEGGLVVFVLLASLAGMIRAKPLRVFGWAFARIRRRLAGRGAMETRVVEFYERFRKLCLRRGFEAQATQTQREFAVAVTDRLRSQLESDQLRQLPIDITELFYRVRFGELQLDTSEMQSLEQRLTQFERALAKAH